MTTLNPKTIAADLDLDAIRYRLAEATPGPWGVGNGTHIVRGLEVTGRGSFTCIQSVAEIDDEDDRLDWGHDDEVEVDPEADAQFIAHARQDIPALLAEVDRLRAAQAAAAGQAEPLTADVDLAGWCAKAAADYRDFEQHEMAMYPDADSRDRALVEWVVRILGNGQLDVSRQVLAVLAERHSLELAPTGTTTEPTNTEQQYLIWSHHHGMWWGPAGRGYRSHHADAGRYALADTAQWLGRGCRCCPVPEVVVPVPAPGESGSTSVGRLIVEATTARIDAGQVNRWAEAVAR